MKASTYIKVHGLPSLAHVARMINKPPQTINNWYQDNFALFEVVVAGCVSTYEDCRPKSERLAQLIAERDYLLEGKEE